MRIKLLGSAGYAGLGLVEFPVEVEADAYFGGCVVAADELYRVGAEKGYFDDLAVYCVSKQHFEVL